MGRQEESGPSGDLHHGVVGEVGLVLGHEHLDRGDHQHQREDEKHRPEPLHHRDTDADHDGAECERREDAPLEDALGVLLGDLEVVEDHQEDEQVVHRERLLYLPAAAAAPPGSGDRQRPARREEKVHQEGGEEVDAPLAALHRQHDPNPERDGRDERPARRQGNVTTSAPQRVHDASRAGTHHIVAMIARR